MAEQMPILHGCDHHSPNGQYGPLTPPQFWDGRTHYWAGMAIADDQPDWEMVQNPAHKAKSGQGSNFEFRHCVDCGAGYRSGLKKRCDKCYRRKLREERKKEGLDVKPRLRKL